MPDVFATYIDTVAFLMAFNPDWCDRDDTGMIVTVSGMKAPENGRVGRVGESRRGTGSGGDCFKMLKTVGVSCHSWMEAYIVTQS